jgi:hypothetical protein
MSKAPQILCTGIWRSTHHGYHGARFSAVLLASGERFDVEDSNSPGELWPIL